MKKQHRRFGPDFKNEAVDLVRRSGKSVNQIAGEWGISQTSLSRWKRQAEADGSDSEVFTAEAELRRLRRENESITSDTAVRESSERPSSPRKIASTSRVEQPRANISIASSSRPSVRPESSALRSRPRS